MGPVHCPTPLQRISAAVMDYDRVVASCMVILRCAALEMFVENGVECGLGDLSSTHPALLRAVVACEQSKIFCIL